MNPFKCRHCDRPAHFYFREGGMLCPDHGALHATAQMKDMLERSRLDKSVSCGGVEGHPRQVTGEAENTDVRQIAGFESCPHDSISPPSVLSPPEAGALGFTPLPVTAGAALSDDLPIFPARRNATTFRVTADNSIQGSPSSFSMGTAGHGAIVSAHNTIVRGG